MKWRRLALWLLASIGALIAAVAIWIWIEIEYPPAITSIVVRNETGESVEIVELRYGRQILAKNRAAERVLHFGEITVRDGRQLDIKIKRQDRAEIDKASVVLDNIVAPYRNCKIEIRPADIGFRDCAEWK